MCSALIMGRLVNEGTRTLGISCFKGKEMRMVSTEEKRAGLGAVVASSQPIDSTPITSKRKAIPSMVAPTGGLRGKSSQQAQPPLYRRCSVLSYFILATGPYQPEHCGLWLYSGVHYELPGPVVEAVVADRADIPSRVDHRRQEAQQGPHSGHGEMNRVGKVVVWRMRSRKPESPRKNEHDVGRESPGASLPLRKPSPKPTSK